MAFCINCGTRISDKAKFCRSCGKAQGTGPEQSQIIQQVQDGQSQENQKDRVMAVLAYILFFVPLIAGTYKTSPFVKYHTNQGTILFIAAIVWGILFGKISAIFAVLMGIVPGLWFLKFPLSIVEDIYWIVPVIFFIYGIVNAVQGKCKPLPLIGRITLFK